MKSLLGLPLLLLIFQTDVGAQITPDTTASLTNAVTFSDITVTSVAIHWTSNEPSAGQAFVVEPGGLIVARSTLDTALKTVHHHTVGELSPSRSYKLFVLVRNAAGRITYSEYEPTATPTRFSFTTLSPNPTAPLDFRQRLTGATTLTAGQKLYWRLDSTRLSGSGTNHLYLNGVTGLPPNSTHRFFCSLLGAGDCFVENATGRLFQWDGTNGSVYLEVSTGTNTPVGSYTVQISTSTSTSPRTISRTMSVTAPPAALPSSSISSIPAIPALDEWEHQMVKYGHKFCDLTTPLTIGWEGDVWYYDGARTYYQIAEYTGNPYWEQCAQYITDAYREYVISNAGVVTGYRVFPHGLYLNYLRTGNSRAKDALELLATKASYASAGGGIEVDLIRETAYHTQAQVTAEKAGFPFAPTFARTKEFALGQVNALMTEALPSVHQPFMDGLMASALIDSHKRIPDPRIPHTLAAFSDFIWDRAWKASEEGFIYRLNDARYDTTGDAGLNQLIAPLYGWLWNITRDSKFLARGDQIFQGGVRRGEGVTSWFGKGFNQNFRASFDYVQNRLNVAIQSDTGGPKYFGVTAKPNRSGEVIIEWLSNEPCTTVIEYGVGGSLSSRVERKPLVSRHQVILSGLNPNAQYAFRLSGEDASRNNAQSRQYSFTTTTADTAPPKLSSVAVKGEVYSWLTDEVADTELLYGATTNLGSSMKPPSSSWTSRAGLYHELTNYSSSVVFFKGRSRDTSGNVAETPLLSAFRGTPPGRPNAPTAQISAPANNTPASGTITITANVTDDGPWVEAQFFIENQKVGFPDSTAPFELTWDTSRADNGTYQIHVVARDADGKTTQSPKVTVNVSNGQDFVAPRAPTGFRSVGP